MWALSVCDVSTSFLWCKYFLSLWVFLSVLWVLPFHVSLPVCVHACCTYSTAACVHVCAKVHVCADLWLCVYVYMQVIFLLLGIPPVSVMCMIVCVNMCLRASIVSACTRYACRYCMHTVYCIHPSATSLSTTVSHFIDTWRDSGKLFMVLWYALAHILQ